MRCRHRDVERCWRCALKELDQRLWQDRAARYGLIALTVLLAVFADRMIYVWWLAHRV